jgi:protein TonB
VVSPRIEPLPTAPDPVIALPSPRAAEQSPAAVQQPQEKLEPASTDRYRQIISAKIRQHEEYPPLAKRRHWEGTTVVQLRFTAEGQVADISVAEKSGHEILDQTAVKMVRSAAPLPSPPEGLRTVLVPIKFRLDS